MSPAAGERRSRRQGAGCGHVRAPRPRPSTTAAGPPPPGVGDYVSRQAVRRAGRVRGLLRAGAGVSRRPAAARGRWGGCGESQDFRLPDRTAGPLFSPAGVGGAAAVAEVRAAAHKGSLPGVAGDSGGPLSPGVLGGGRRAPTDPRE